MGKLVPESVGPPIPEDFGEGWRVERDPVVPTFVWRCRALTYEYKALVGVGGSATWRWYAIDSVPNVDLNERIPARVTLWLDLFLHP